MYFYRNAHWFNNIRIHGTLSYVSPIDYKLEHLIQKYLT
ncbi:MAG: IS3 family transposase [Bacillota bacterium]